MSLVEKLAEKAVKKAGGNESLLPNVVANLVANEKLPASTNEQLRRIHELRSTVERLAREIMRG